jgi:hypothetical protein
MITRTIKQTGLALAVATFAFSTSCKKEKKEANTMPNGSYVVSDVRVMGMSLTDMLNPGAGSTPTLQLDGFMGMIIGNLVAPQNDVQKKFSYLFWATFKEGYKEYKKVVADGSYKTIELFDYPGINYSFVYNLVHNNQHLPLNNGEGAINMMVLLFVAPSIINGGLLTELTSITEVNNGYKVNGGLIKREELIKDMRDLLISVDIFLGSYQTLVAIGDLIDKVNTADINAPFESWDGSKIPILSIIGNFLQPKGRAFSLTSILDMSLYELRTYANLIGVVLSKVNTEGTSNILTSLPTLLAQARFNFTPAQVDVMTGETFSTSMLKANIEWIDASALHARMYYYFDTANPYKRVALRATFEPTANGYLMAPQDLEGGIMDIVNLLMNMGGEKSATETRASQSRLNLGNLIQLELTKVNN